MIEVEGVTLVHLIPPNPYHPPNHPSTAPDSIFPKCVHHTITCAFVFAFGSILTLSPFVVLSILNAPSSWSPSQIVTKISSALLPIMFSSFASFAVWLQLRIRLSWIRASLLPPFLFGLGFPLCAWLLGMIDYLTTGRQDIGLTKYLLAIAIALVFAEVSVVRRYVKCSTLGNG